MKKLLGVLGTLLIFSILFTACPENPGTETPEEEGPVPENAFRYWTPELDEEVNEWSVVGVKDLEKLV